MSKSKIEQVVSDGKYKIARSMAYLLNWNLSEDIEKYTERLIEKDILIKRKQKLKIIINKICSKKEIK